MSRNWDAVTGDVSYSLAVNLHRLYGVFVNEKVIAPYAEFLTLTMPWTYPLISTTASKTSEGITRDMAYWALVGTTLLVPYRYGTAMQGVGKTTAALYFACAPLTREFWVSQPWRWLGREQPPYDLIEDCVDGLVSEGLVVNSLDAFKELVRRAETEGVKYPVVVLDDLSAWASSRNVSVWRVLTSLLTTLRSHVGIMIATAAATNQVFIDIRRNATLVGEVGQYAAEKCGGVRTTWMRCRDKAYTCMGGKGAYMLIDVGFGPISTMICDDLADRIRHSEGYKTLNIELRGRLIMRTVMPSIDDLIETIKYNCKGKGCEYASAFSDEDYVNVDCVNELLAKYKIHLDFGGAECVGVDEVRARLKEAV